MNDIIEINDLKPWQARLESFGGKKRNKRLMQKLAALNRLCPGPESYFAELGLSPEERGLLETLAAGPDAWRPLCFSENPAGFCAQRAARLGLVRLNLRGRIALTDAGRFFLSLTAKNEDIPRT